MNPIERLRKEVITELMELKTMQGVWPNWITEIQSKIDVTTPINSQNLIDLGSSLHSIFTSTSSGTRSQGQVAAGGTAWEGLVCWYLNLCLIGSRTIIVKAKKKHIPTPISNSITVMYGSTPSNTESDLLAITFPQEVFDHEFSGTVVKLKQYLDEITTRLFTDTELTVIQCKTNWNDNAQIPMLWDLIYSSTGFNAAASVGRNGFVCSALSKFTYAFATVPTVNPSKIKATSTCVLRVKSISGGNYWGLPSQSGIAMNLSEMLNKNFNTSLHNYPGGWPTSIGRAITNQVSIDDYFKLI